MPGPRFFALAHRLFAYQGVMRARAVADQDADTHTPAMPPRGGRRDAEQVAGTREALETHPLLSSMISFG